jgi:hypothetical protein
LNPQTPLGTPLLSSHQDWETMNLQNFQNMAQNLLGKIAQKLKKKQIL